MPTRTTPRGCAVDVESPGAATDADLVEMMNFLVKTWPSEKFDFYNMLLGEDLPFAEFDRRYHGHLLFNKRFESNYDLSESYKKLSEEYMRCLEKYKNRVLDILPDGIQPPSKIEIERRTGVSFSVIPLMGTARRLKVFHDEKFGSILRDVFITDEKDMFRLLTSYLKRYYGSSMMLKKGAFLYCAGDIPVMLNAHVDTWEARQIGWPRRDLIPSKHLVPREIYATSDGILVPEQLGYLAGDDRAGVFAILMVVMSGRKPHVLIDTREENGPLDPTSGAMKAVKEISVNGKAVPWDYIIGIDFIGNNMIAINGGGKKFRSYLQAFGFDIVNCTGGDISALCPGWNVPGILVSAGFYNQHSYNDCVVLKDLFNTISKINLMLDHPPTGRFSYKAPPREEQSCETLKVKRKTRSLPFF